MTWQDKVIESHEKESIPEMVTDSQLEDLIDMEQYYVFPGTTVTVCCLVLRNGFGVVGKSACASPEIFSEELGQKFARADAKNKMWDLEGYVLRNKLASIPK